MAVLTTAIAAASLPRQSAQPLLLMKGIGRSAPGGPSTLAKPRAVNAKTHKTQPRTLKRPTALHLTKAGSAVFNMRKLKGVVVRRERPEPGTPAGVETSLPPSVNPAQLPAIQTTSAPAPAPDSSFDGLDFATWGAGHPPDENGDVGPTYYIQTVNTSIGIYDKSTGTRVAAFTFNSFMSQGSFGNLCDTNNFGDPVVLYDTYENRWFITDFAFKLDAGGNVNPQHVFQCFAVSKTGDPVNGGWNFYSIEDPGGLADYPKFGVWPDGIYMSANMFGYASGASYFGFHVWALNKQQMYAGAPNPQVVDFAGDMSDFTVIPANSRLQDGAPPAGSSEYFVSTEQFLNGLSIYKFHVDWDKVSTSTFTGPFVQLAPNCWPNASPTSAATTANAADVLAIRAMAQAQYTNQGGAESLWVDHTVQRNVSATNTTCNATTGGNASVRWYQANLTGGTVASNVVQGATFDPEGANTFYRFMPALAVDRVGDLAVGYAKSNATTPPQIKYAGRLAGDPLNTLGQSEQTLMNGTGSQSGSCGGAACIRWGDYSGMSLDPNGCEFWMTGEYYATTGLNDLTRIGSFHDPGCITIGNGTLSGTVTDGVNPVAGATVTLGSRVTTTDAGGGYSFTVPAGTYVSLTAAKFGFGATSASSLAVPSGGTLTRNLTLTASAQSGCFTDNTQDSFQRGVPGNCDLVGSPGDVVLASPDNTDAANADVTGSGFGFTNTAWAGQTFTPTVTGKLKRVDVELFCSTCTTAGPDITLSIRATTGSPAVPTGADLASATLTGFNDDGAGGLKTFTFGSPITLSAGTTYALVFRANAAFATGTYAYTCSCSPNSNPYSSGQFVTSSTSGSSWAADTAAGGRDLNFVTYINPGFASSGTFVSSLKDANPDATHTAHWTTLSWTATTPAGTAVKFQVAASNAANGPFDYVGPDGTAGTFFTTSGATLSQFDDFRYLRYKAYLTTSDSSVTPSLSSVAVCFANAVATTTTLAVNAATGALGGTTDLSATLTAGGAVNAASIQFSLNGFNVGSATTNVSGIATLNSVSLAGIDAGTYLTGVTASFAGGAGHGPSVGSNSLTIGKLNQSITVTTHAPAIAAFGTSFAVAATAPGGPVSFSSSGACTNSGSTFTVTAGAGTCSVKYDQAGSTNFNPATQIVESVTGQKANQAIAVTTPAPATAAVGVSFGVAATAPAGAVTFSSSGACTNSGSTFTMTTATGTCSVMYEQAGNANYNAAGQVVETVTAQKAAQTITVTTHAPATALSGSSFSVAATAPGGTVTFSSAGACTNSGSTFTMTAATGMCSVMYDQPGNANYDAAPRVTESVAAAGVQKFLLIVHRTGFGGGTVTSTPAGIKCSPTCAASFDQGTKVTLKATVSGVVSHFGGWSGACRGSGPTCTVTMDSAKTVTALFIRIPGEPCVVPNVKGKPLATARKKIAFAHCSVGKVTKARSKTVKKGNVVSQSPKPAKQLAPRGRVNLVVSKGKR